MKRLLSKLNTAQTIVAVISGLVIGAMGIIYAVWEFSDKLAERQRIEREAENAEQAETIALMVRAMWVNDLDSLKRSIHSDLKTIIESNTKRDSVLAIVLPKFVNEISQVKKEVRGVRTMVSINSAQSDDDRVGEVLRYFQEANRIDSVSNINMQIMRELRAINRQLLNQPKYGDRLK